MTTLYDFPKTKDYPLMSNYVKAVSKWKENFETSTRNWIAHIEMNNSKDLRALVLRCVVGDFADKGFSCPVTGRHTCKGCEKDCHMRTEPPKLTVLTGCGEKGCSNNDKNGKCTLASVDLVISNGRSTDYFDELVCEQGVGNK